MNHRITLILIGALISYAYYLFFSLGDLGLDTSDGKLIRSKPDGVAPDGAIAQSESNNKNQSTLADAVKAIDGGDSTTAGKLEIGGRIADSHNQPVGDVLVALERETDSTYSDSDGRYKLIFAIPDYHEPVLRILRDGYKGKRIRLDAEAIKQKSAIGLDIKLDDDPGSIVINGWVGNAIGAGLGDLKIQTSTRTSQGMDEIVHTVSSNDRGYFTLEGVRSGHPYKLTIFSPPEYRFYFDGEFSVTQDTPPLKIILVPLNFIDIDGMVVNNEAVPVPDFEFYIRNESTEPEVRKLVTDSSGFFSLNHFPAGEVSLTTQGPEYFEIKGLMLAENEYRNLGLVVDKGNHYLSGWVSDENGVPVETASVYLSAEFTDGSVKYSSYRIKATDNSGIFYFDNLGSGEHLLTVRSNGFKTQEFTHRFVSQTDNLHISLSRR